MCSSDGLSIWFAITDVTVTIIHKINLLIELDKNVHFQFTYLFFFTLSNLKNGYNTILAYNFLI